MHQKRKVAAKVLKEALQMERDDRAMIAERLISSLDPEVEPEIERLWQLEIQKRLKDSRNNQVEFLSWDEVRRKIKRTYHGNSR
jgi:putative addiction module component (TIGR02574 family)